MKPLKFNFACMLLSFAFFNLACNSGQNTHQEQATSDSSEMKVMIPQSDCYMWANGRDTILSKVERFPNVVTGTLKYHFSEKDANDGTLEGKMAGNRLIADYSFTSEGRQSVRQVAFLLQGDTAIEGYTEMEERAGKMVFKDTSKIDFTAGTKLTKISCVENDEKFRTSATTLKNENGHKSFFANTAFALAMPM